MKITAGIANIATYFFNFLTPQLLLYYFLILHFAFPCLAWRPGS